MPQEAALPACIEPDVQQRARCATPPPPVRLPLLRAARPSPRQGNGSGSSAQNVPMLARDGSHTRSQAAVGSGNGKLAGELGRTGVQAPTGRPGSGRDEAQLSSAPPGVNVPC